MLLKDHYRVLGLEPSATLPEIKKAYRRLALTLHPDKTHGDPYAKEQFHAVKEAYEVLTNPLRKEQYLQQRWYYQSLGRKKTSEVTTPETVLKLAIELDRYVSLLDVHRMDKQGLVQYMLDILNPETIEKLNRFNDGSINGEIITLFLRCTRPLSLNHVEMVGRRLNELTHDKRVAAAMEEYLNLRRKSDSWEKRRIWIVLLAVIVLTLLILFASN